MRRRLVKVGPALALVCLIGLATSACGVPIGSSPQALPQSELPRALTEPPGKPGPVATTGVRVPVYFLVNSHLFAQPAFVPKHPSLQELLTALEAGPTIAQYGKGITTALQGTSNLVAIRVLRGIAEVGLDQAYYQLSEPQAVLELGQIVYTVSDLPSVKSVQFFTNGAAVDVETEYGNTVSGPVTSADYCHESSTGCPHAGH
jgi:hypothetical protein